MKGNEAIAEGAIRAGCRYYFGYPITPQNDIPEYLSRELPKIGGTFIQAESEVASINMLMGAAAGGMLPNARARTATVIRADGKTLMVDLDSVPLHILLSFMLVACLEMQDSMLCLVPTILVCLCSLLYTPFL